MLLKQAEYMAATASPSTRQSPFARGWVHIRHRFPLGQRSRAAVWRNSCTQHDLISDINVSKLPLNNDLLPDFEGEA